jgi:diguanylate cyclase (GGDEF)-like protein
MKLKRITISLAVITIIVAYWSFLINQQPISDTQANQGTLLFSSFDNQELYLLDGQWQYYPDMLADEITESTLPFYVTFTHQWQPESNQNKAHGVATYQLFIKGLQPNTQYGLVMKEVKSAYELTINGVSIMHNGVVSKNPSEYIAKSYTERGVFTSDVDGNALLTLQVANFTRGIGGVSEAPIISSPNVALRYFEISVTNEMILASVLLIIAFFFVIISEIGKNKNALLIALFSLLIGIFIVISGNRVMLIYLQTLPMMLIIRAQYSIGYASILLFGLIAENFEFITQSRVRKNILYGAMIVSVLFSLILPLPILEQSLNFLAFFLIAYILYYTIVLFIGYSHQIVGSNYVFFGMILLGVGTFLNFYVFRTHSILYYAVLLFTIFTATSILIRFGIIREEKEHLEKASLHDSLTNVGNRQMLYQWIETLHDKIEDHFVYIIFIDLDHFKQVNDQYGHRMGDRVLQIVAQRIRNTIHKDDLVIRFAGDEFIIGCLVKRNSNINIITKRIKDSFSKPIVIDSRALYVGVSLGTTIYHPNQDNIEDIINRSDALMYQDKKTKQIA